MRLNIDLEAVIPRFKSSKIKSFSFVGVCACYNSSRAVRCFPASSIESGTSHASIEVVDWNGMHESHCDCMSVSEGRQSK